MAAIPNVQEVLEGLEYPADAASILACAKAHKAAPQTLTLLNKLPAQAYDNLSEINHVLGRIEDHDGPLPKR